MRTTNWKQHWKQPGTVLALLVLLLACAWALLPGIFATHDPYKGVDVALAAPSAEHFFGTDAVGRDVYSRVVYGARQSLLGAIIAVAVGLVFGTLIGLLFLNPLLGTAVGAGAGALSGYFTDVGIEDNFLKDATQALPPGGAALCVLVRKVTADKVLPAMSEFGGTVLRTNLTAEQENKLREGLKAAG